MDIYERIKFFYESVKTEKTVYGKSLFNRELYAIKVGDGYPVGLVQYAIHGREYITAELAKVHFERGANGTLWILPLTNPDGALLSQTGLASAPKKQREFLLSLNGGNEDFSLWKANGRGVDLNVNFPACWGKGMKNTRFAGAENYIGAKPFSEVETLALKNFTEKIKPDYTVSYHTKGEEVYWYFYQSIWDCSRDKNLALALSRSTGYKLAYAKGSAGGYKDWCIKKFSIPSFTVEAGADSLTHPIMEKNFEELAKKNGNAIYDLSKEYQNGI